MKTKDLTYENWLEGKFELNNVYTIRNESNDRDSPLIDPSSIQEDQLALVNDKQSKLFDKLVKEQTKIFLDDFNKRYTESKFPKTTLRIEANRIVAYIRGKRENYSKEEVLIEKIGKLVSKHSQKNHHNYVNRRIQGYQILNSFVPSPNSDYFEHKQYILPEVYAESLINLYEHLSNFDNSLDPIRLFPEPYKSLFQDEPHNDYPKIFSSGYAHILFLNIEEALIIPSSTSISGDYVWINS